MSNPATTHGYLPQAIHQSANVDSKHPHDEHHTESLEHTSKFRDKLHHARQRLGNILEALSAHLEQDGRDHGDAIHQSANVDFKHPHDVHYTETLEHTSKFREKLHHARQRLGNMLEALSAHLGQDGRDHGDDSKAGRHDLISSKQDQAQAIASGVFQINTTVSTFRWQVNTLGTPEDEPEIMEALLLENENALQEILRDEDGNEGEVRQVQEDINFLKTLVNDLKSFKQEQADAIKVQNALPNAQLQDCPKKSNSPFVDCFLQIFGSCFLWK